MLLLAPPNYRRDDHLESKLSWVYNQKTDEQLSTLALDVIQNRVFLSSYVRDQRDLQMVFMILALADRRTLRFFDWIGVNLFYEYYDKAGPRSVNGYPCFFSLAYLDRGDTEKLFGKVKRLQAAMTDALNE